MNITLITDMKILKRAFYDNFFEIKICIEARNPLFRVIIRLIELSPA